MHVAQEVDIGLGAVHAPVFHQEVLEYHLQLVPLRNNHQLQTQKQIVVLIRSQKSLLRPCVRKNLI